MKYVKHMTLKEWNRFNKVQKNSNGIFTPPGKDYNFRNHATGKMEALQSITGQEILLSKYKIILTGYEPKWTRRYHAFTAVVNQKNVDKSISSFNKAVNAFSGGMGNGKTQSKQDKKNHDVIFGRSSKKSNDVLFGKSSKKSNDVLFGKSSKKSNDVLFGKSSKNNHDALFGKSSKNNHDALFGKSKSKRKSKKSNSLSIWNDDKPKKLKRKSKKSNSLSIWGDDNRTPLF